MNACRLPLAPSPASCDFSPLDGEMVELNLLLPAWQAEVLEAAAQDQGLTTAQLLRSIIRDYCTSH